MCTDLFLPSCCIFQCVPLEHGGFKEPLDSNLRHFSMPCPAFVGFQEVLQGCLSGKTQHCPAVAEWSSARSCFSYPFLSSHRIVLPFTPSSVMLSSSSTCANSASLSLPTSIFLLFPLLFSSAWRKSGSLLDQRTVCLLCVFQKG